MARPIPRLAPVTSAVFGDFIGAGSLIPQYLAQGFQVEIIAPHDTLVNPQPFVLVINRVLQKALPGGSLPGQEVGAGQGFQDSIGILR